MPNNTKPRATTATPDPVMVSALRDLYNESYEATAGSPRAPGLVSALQQARVLLRRLPESIAPDVIDLAPYVPEPEGGSR